MGSLMFDAGKAAAEAPARFSERQRIVAFIRSRRAKVVDQAKKRLITEAEAFRMKRWLEALAEDIDLQRHDDELE